MAHRDVTGPAMKVRTIQGGDDPEAIRNAVNGCMSASSLWDKLAIPVLPQLGHRNLSFQSSVMAERIIGFCLFLGPVPDENSKELLRSHAAIQRFLEFVRSGLPAKADSTRNIAGGPFLPTGDMGLPLIVSNPQKYIS